MELEVGQHYRSQSSKVLMTVVEINKEKDKVILRVADSDFEMEGPLHSLSGLFEETSTILISDKDYTMYLKTYKEDMRKQNTLEKGNK